MDKLVNLVLRAKESDEEAMLDILEIFEPLIKKYHRLLGYEEDAKQEIICKIIKLIKTDIIFEKLRNINDSVLFKYKRFCLSSLYILIKKQKFCDKL